MGFSADAPATRVAAVAVVQSDEARHHACLYDLACAQRQEANRSSSGRTGRTTRSTTASTAEGTELAGALRLLAHSGSQHTDRADSPRHLACGTPIRVRWYCPTCDQLIDHQPDHTQVHFG